MLFLMTLMVEVVALIVTGACGMFLWNWFIPLAIPAAPQLSFALAMGLSLVISCFVESGKSYKLRQVLEKNSELIGDALITQVIQGISKPIVLLLFGWVIHAIIN